MRSLSVPLEIRYSSSINVLCLPFETVRGVIAASVGVQLRVLQSMASSGTKLDVLWASIPERLSAPAELGRSQLGFLRGVEAAGLRGILTVGVDPKWIFDGWDGERHLKDMKEAIGVFGRPDVRVHAGEPHVAQNAEWNPRLAAGALRDALSRIYLPEVGLLPLDAIAEMKNRLEYLLNPMRAELLRLTDDLRAATKDHECDAAIAYEAEALITTRVEPIVREAGQKAEEMMKKKWRRFFQGVVKVFGLTGAAFLKPDLLTDALKEVLNTGAALADRDENKEALGDTAHFVLEARSYLVERGAGAE
jgi:hypothetical protein